LKPLAFRNALNVSHDRFRADAERLIGGVRRALESAPAEQQRKREVRLRAEQRLRAAFAPVDLKGEVRLRAEQAIFRLWAEQERLQTEQRRKERLVAQMRIPLLLGLVVSLTSFLLAMFVPAVGSTLGWQIAFGIASVIFNGGGAVAVASIAGTLANLLFLFAGISFIFRVFLNRSWPGRLAALASGLCVVCALASTVFFQDYVKDYVKPSDYHLGFYLWHFSMILLVVANVATTLLTRAG
jgi:hypothetical protein